MNEVEKPKNRGKIRRIIGTEYFVLKRKLDWLLNPKKWSSKSINIEFDNIVFTHKSMISRPLLGVDMTLQENKKTNLKIAIKHLDKIIIKPNETFSLWKNVGKQTKRKGYLEGLVLSQGKVKS